MLLTILAAATLMQPAVTVVRAARVLDVASGRMTANGSVVVQDGRISAVNPATPPAGATVIDLGNVTLLPGFIDLHTHLVSEISAASFTEPVTSTSVDGAFTSIPNARKTVMAGFTTVRDFGGDITVALGKAVDKGIITGPRIIASRNALGITGGHCDVTGFAPGILEGGPEDGVADGVDEVVKAVRYQIKHGAQVIKTCATAGVLSLEGPVGAQQYSEEELRAMVDEATRHGVRVAAHAHGAAGIKAAIRAGVTTIEHGSEIDDEAIGLMKEHGTWLVPTTYLVERIPLAMLPAPIRAKAELILPIARKNLEHAIASGVRIAFGTDAGVYPHGENAGEFVVYVKLGMTPLRALQTATIYAADALGKTDRGEIATGKLADLIAVEGNPLEDITATQRVRWVMLGGKVLH